MPFIEKFVFLALVFSIPFQKRVFLFGPSPKGEGFFEWSSGFVYFTDFLVFLLAAFWLKDFLSRKNLNPRIDLRFRPSLFLVIFLGFAFISLTQAGLVDVGIYRFLKLGEFIFLFFYVLARVNDNSRKGDYLTPPPPLLCRERGKGGEVVMQSGRRVFIGTKETLWAFIASGVFQSILAILQFAKQSSLGLEIFHESTIAIGFKGVAEISAGGVDFIRAYGTFPSPNVLAGFLGICLLFAFCLFLQEPKGRLVKKQATPRQFCRTKNHIISIFSKKSLEESCGSRGPNRPPPLWAQRAATVLSCKIGAGALFLSRCMLYGGTFFLLTFGLLLTFSRGVIIFFLVTSILFFAGIFLFKKLKQYKKQALHLLLLVAGCWLLVAALAWPEISSRFLESSVGEPAIQERLFFNEVGVDTLKQNYARLFFGVGIGNFVHNYMQSLPGLAPHLYQPVHNIFILIASEIGILGLLAFILFLVNLLKESIKRFAKNLTVQDDHDRGHLVYVFSLFLVFCFLFLIAAYDHYFWTLQQGGLMFWTVLGLIGAVQNKSPQYICCEE